MTALYKHIKTYFLIYLALLIYLLFYVSVAWTGWFDIFFSGAALHAGAKGIDFYQLPKGAWAFWHGGSLSGDLPSGTVGYGKDYFSNGNVYHPFFTLTFGTFLSFFDAASAPYIWLGIKLLISLPIIAYFFWNFRNSKYSHVAVFILCANFSVYLELAAWQFQFLLNMFLLLFLILLIKYRSVYWSGVCYWLGMLVKPVGLLFVPVLLFKGRWRSMLLGIWLFVISTLGFLLSGSGKYFLDNLLANLSSSGTLGPNQIITFSALLHYTTHWPDLLYQALQDGSLLIIVFLSTLRRIHIAKAIFLTTVYYLCFYQGVYEYQWSTLAYVLAICVVTCPEFQTRWVLGCVLLTCLPDCFIVLNLLHIDVKDMGYLGLIPGPTAWEWMILSKLVPLMLLLVSVIAADIKPIFRQIREFWSALWKVNKQLKVFGDGDEHEKPVDKGAENTEMPLSIG